MADTNRKLYEIEVMRNNLESAVKCLLTFVYTRNIKKNEVINTLLTSVLEKHRVIVSYMIRYELEGDIDEIIRKIKETRKINNYGKNDERAGG